MTRDSLGRETPLGKAFFDELSQRPSLHLLHKIASMKFDGALGHIQLSGDQLIGKPFQNEIQNFTLAFG